MHVCTHRRKPTMPFMTSSYMSIISSSRPSGGSGGVAAQRRASSNSPRYCTGKHDCPRVCVCQCVCIHNMYVCASTLVTVHGSSTLQHVHVCVYMCECVSVCMHTTYVCASMLVTVHGSSTSQHVHVCAWPLLRLTAMHCPTQRNDHFRNEPS